MVAGRDLFDDPCRSRSAPEWPGAKSLSGGKHGHALADFLPNATFIAGTGGLQRHMTLPSGPKQRNLFLHVLLTITSKKRA